MADWAAMVRRARRRPLFAAEGLPALALDRAQIERVLPHRGPMLLLDALLRGDLDAGRLVARRRLGCDDLGFEGHFPGDPVYPGALLLEMSGQLGLCLPALRAGGGGAAVRLIRVCEAVFCAEARPGDELTVLAEALEDTDYTLMVIGQVLRGEVVLAVSVIEALRGGVDG